MNPLVEIQNQHKFDIDMDKSINVLAMFRNKNKLSFFSIHQLYNKIKNVDPTIKITFHIIWDTNEELNGLDKKYEELINQQFGDNIVSYDKNFLNNYCNQYYNVSDAQIKSFDNFYLIYRIILGHYLRRVKLLEHFIIIDDDIIIQCDFKNIIEYSLKNTPFLITEPMNCNCDKILFNTLSNMYDTNQFIEKYKHINPNCYGFNAGFQGIDASLFDDYLSPDNFHMLLSLFDYTTPKKPDGTDRFDEPALLFKLSTQEQSFFSCMNICKSRIHPVILNISEYFVIPNWGTHPIFGEIDHLDENEGWTFALKSKIVHFIGHTQGKGKPKTFLKIVDNYLTINGIL